MIFRIHLYKDNSHLLIIAEFFLKLHVHRLRYENLFLSKFRIFKSHCFSKILSGMKLRIHFDRKHVVMKSLYKNNNTTIASRTLFIVSVEFTSKTMETHLKYVLQFSAMDEISEYVTGHLISPKHPVQRIAGQFVNKTCNFSHLKNIIV